MDIPTILQPDSSSDYQVQLNQSLRDNLVLGIAVPVFTSAQITSLLAQDATPIIPQGAQFYDSTINKMKIVVTQAVAGVSNGATETITSV